ncbi:1324_t:CDS:2, partial [Racocetra fulgida]
SPPSRLIDNKNSTIPGEKSALAIFYVALLKGTLWYIPPEAVEFVEAYGDFARLNTPAEDGLENDELDILENDAIQNEGMENNGIGLPNIAPIPEQNANRPEQLGNNNDGEFVFQNGMRLPLFQPQLQFENLEPMQQPEIEPVQNQMQDTGELRVENLAPQTEMPGLNQNDIESDWMEDEYHQINNGDTQIESNVEAIDKSPVLLYQDDFEGDKNSGSIQSISTSTSSVPHPTWDNEQSNDSGSKSIVADVQQPPFYVPYAATGTRLSISDYMDEINQKDEDESLAQSDFLTGSSKSDELPSSSQKLPSLASNNSNLGQFESKCVDTERDDEAKSKSTQNFSSTSKTSSGQYNIGNLGGTRRIRPISKVRRVGAPTPGLLNTQKLGATSTNPSSYDNEETVNGTSSMDLNYHKVSSTKESPSDNNGDYEEASETSDSDEDNEDINLQEKYPREVGTAYSPSRDITNGNVYYADDSAFPLHRIPKNGQNSSVTNLFGNNNPIERENAEQGGGPVDVIDGGDNGQPDPGLDVNNVQQQARQEQQADTIWTQIWNWIANVLNDIPDLNNEAQDNDPQAVNGNQVAMNPPIGPVRREPNAEAPVFPVPVFNEAIDVPVAGPALGLEPEEEEEENVANEDLEGVLEAIGMRGSLWMLAQNSALMAVLIALCLFDTSLMIYVQDITNQSRYIIAHSASLLTQITSTSGKITNGTVIDSNVNHISEFLEGQNLTVLVKIIDRWNGFAYGNTPTDKIVAFFVAIELLIFPIICGILLDLSTLPLFPDATPTSRLEFYLESPVTSTFLHWFTGTAFMFHFAVFVSLCREIVRTGVMWFIRDPNDPQFHPIKEILERPAPIVDNNAIENDDVAFVKDGGFVRAPSYDAVPVEPGKRMLIPVTEDGVTLEWLIRKCQAFAEKRDRYADWADIKQPNEQAGNDSNARNNPNNASLAA